jgi:hypothetical protein
VQTTFVVWRDLIGILSRRGLPQQTRAVLGEMRAEHGVAPNQSCYIRVVRTFCNAKVPVDAAPGGGGGRGRVRGPRGD